MPRTRAERLALLEPLLQRRILLLDGAMGTMIQTYRLEERDFRGERFANCAPGAAGQQRPALPDPAEDHRRHPCRLPRGRRGYPGDQFVHQQRQLPGRLWPRGPGLRAEPRRGGAGPRGGRPVRAAGARPSPVRRRSAGPHQPHRLALPRRQRPGVPQHRFRRPGGHLRRRHEGAARRRRGPDPDRDHLRYPERQGRDLRGGVGVREPGLPGAGHDLRNHHRRVRPDAVGTDRRGVLALASPMPGRSASGSTARSAPRRCAPMSRSWPGSRRCW